MRYKMVVLVLGYALKKRTNFLDIQYFYVSGQSGQFWAVLKLL